MKSLAFRLSVLVFAALLALPLAAQSAAAAGMVSFDGATG